MRGVSEAHPDLLLLRRTRRGPGAVPGAGWRGQAAAPDDLELLPGDTGLVIRKAVDAPRAAGSRRCAAIPHTGLAPEQCPIASICSTSRCRSLLGIVLALLVGGDAALWMRSAVALPILVSWALHVWVECPAQPHGPVMALAARSSSSAASAPRAVPLPRSGSAATRAAVR